MEIGLHLPSAQPGASPEGILQVARAAEGHGFDTVWMFDHLFTPTGLDSKYPYSREGDYPLSAADPFFDPLGLFGVLSRATERMKLGTLVMIPAYRNPIVLGKIVATIENFAPGRVLLGIGAGWMREEFEAVDIDPKTRARRFEEYIKALRTVWSGEPSSFEGEFYSWTESGMLPAPTRPVPLVIGGHVDAALRRAARLGDGWAAITGRGQGSGIDALAPRIDLLHSFLEAEGRSPEGFEIVYASALWFSDHINDKLPLTGPPDHIAASLKRLGDLGVTMVDLIVFGPAGLITENAARFAEEVRPLL